KRLEAFRQDDDPQHNTARATDLSCPICYEVYNDPVVPSCGHSFCRTCLQRMWAKVGATVWQVDY
uniref:RING-type domain-containing protein n=1 Tax=Astyanax mexicanus TaxID=7994 RepID=A0A8B9JSH4_ASTMX